jgi:hypothetical protein
VLTLSRSETLEAKTGFQGTRIFVHKGVDLSSAADQAAALIDSNLESSISTGIEGFICAARNIFRCAPELAKKITGFFPHRSRLGYGQHPSGTHRCTVTVSPNDMVTLSLPFADALQLTVGHDMQNPASNLRMFIKLHGRAGFTESQKTKSGESQFEDLDALMVDAVKAIPEDSIFESLNSAACAVATQVIALCGKIDRLIEVQSARVQIVKNDGKVTHRGEATRKVNDPQSLWNDSHGMNLDEGNVTPQECDSAVIEDGITSNRDELSEDPKEPSTVTAGDREPRITFGSEESDIGAAAALGDEALIEDSAASEHDPKVRPSSTKEGGVYIALGSNLGDRLKNIEMACKLMDEDPDIHILQTSHLYETEPMYYENQDRFLNGACEV